VATDGVAVFVNNGSGSYILLNSAMVYDEVVLPAAKFFVPTGKTLTLGVYPELGAPERTAKMTVPVGGSLTIQNNGFMVMQKTSWTDGKDYPALLENRGTLSIENGASIENTGIIDSIAGLIDCSGTGVIDSSDGRIELKARENGSPTPLSLNMKGGTLLLRASSGLFNGAGVNIIGNQSVYIEIRQGEPRTNQVVLPRILSTGTASVIISSLYQHKLAQGVESGDLSNTIGRLKVTDRIECGGSLTANGLELTVGTGGIRASSLTVDGATLACQGPIVCTSFFNSSCSYMNLSSAPSASSQTHTMSMIVSPADLPLPDRVYQDYAFTVQQFNLNVAFRGNFYKTTSGALTILSAGSEGPAYLTLSLPSVNSLTYTAIVETDAEFSEVVEVDVGLHPDWGNYGGPAFTVSRKGDHSLGYFLLIGADSAGRRIWHIYPDSPAPADLNALYTAIAVYYRTVPSSFPTPPGGESYIHSNQTGAGVLGGGNTSTLPSIPKPSWATESTPATSGGGGTSAPAPAPAQASFSFQNGNSTYTQGSSTGLVLSIQKDFSLFSGVKVNDTVLSKDKDYTAVNGSTIITLLPSYLNNLSSGSYTLTANFKDNSNVSTKFTVAAQTQQPQQLEPTQPAIPVTPFADITGADWFVNSVIYVYNNGLMAGTNVSPMLFSPNATLTRGMIVSVLYRHAGSPNVSSFDNPFDDVPASWYTEGVIWAAANGIVSGYGNNRFGPEDNITREQMATILNNYADFTGIDLRETRQIVVFADDTEIAAYAKDSIDRFYRAGIISGKPGNIFDPKAGASRAEFASMLHRFLTSV